MADATIWRYVMTISSSYVHICDTNFNIQCITPGCNAWVFIIIHKDLATQSFFCSHFCYKCGQLVIRSAVRNEVQRALESHYGRCELFGQGESWRFELWTSCFLLSLSLHGPLGTCTISLTDIQQIIPVVLGWLQLRDSDVIFSLRVVSCVRRKFEKKRKRYTRLVESYVAFDIICFLFSLWVVPNATHVRFGYHLLNRHLDQPCCIFDRFSIMLDWVIRSNPSEN